MHAPGILALLLAQAVTTAPAPPPVAFHLTPQGAIIVPVALEGSDPVAFMIDTGSNASLMSEALASALGAQPIARTTMASAAGQKEALVTRIGHLTLGGIAAADVLMTVVPDIAINVPDAAADGLSVKGVIGQDVLGGFRYTIDYRERRIVWHDAGAKPPRRAAMFELEPRDDRFLVVLPQDRDVLRLVPDSGADTLVLFQREGDPRSDMTPGADFFQLTGVTGTRGARRAVVHALRIGTTTLKDVSAVIVGREAASPAADGLLPLHIFARVTFNGPERQLLIENR